MRLRLSPRALDDLAEIRAYLLPRSPRGAENVRIAITDTMDLLVQFPHCGRSTDIGKIRLLPVVRFRYLIYHTVAASEVVIVHVRHASRDAPGAEDFE